MRYTLGDKIFVSIIAYLHEINPIEVSKKVTNKNINKWNNINKAFKNLYQIVTIFTDIFCAYKDILNKGNSIKRSIHKVNSYKCENNMKVISNESARECELYKEYSDKNQKLICKLLNNYGISCKLNEFIPQLYSYYCPIYEIGYELGNYRKHVSYNIPICSVNNEIYINIQQLLMNKEISSKCKNIINSHPLILENGLKLTKLIDIIRICAKKQIMFVAKSFVHCNYINKFYYNILCPIHSQQIGFPARIIHTSRGKGFQTYFDEDNFIILIQELNDLGCIAVKIKEGFLHKYF